MPKVDFLIVGGGLAGLQMALQCHLAGRSYIILDDERPAATNAAAGLVNPITGRNYVKTWLYDDLILSARKIYHEWEKLLGQKVFLDLEIRRVLNTIAEENKWHGRLSDPIYQSLMDEKWHSTSNNCLIKGADKVVRLKQGFRLDTRNFLRLAHHYFLKVNSFRREQFSFESFELSSKTYKDVTFQHLIFCRGGYEKGQPFDFLPIIPNMGEVLIIKITSKRAFTYAIKKKLFIVPLGDDLYWVGGTYNNLNHAKTDVPSFVFLEESLDAMVQFDYEIIERVSGIRGTTPDRKPMIGIHPKFRHLSIFNGLGTKGASLSPLFSEMLFNKISKPDQEIIEDVDILRYYKEV